MTNRSLLKSRRNAPVSQTPDFVPGNTMARRPESSGRHAGAPAPQPAPNSTWRPQVAENAKPRVDASDAPTRVMRALRDAEAESGLRDGFTKLLPVVDPAAPSLPRGVTHTPLMPVTQLLPAVQTADSPSPEVEGSGRRVGAFQWAPSERGLRNPAMRLAVSLFRRAQWLSRERNRRLDVMETQLDSWDGQIAAFAERWKHVDAHWDQVRRRLDDSATGRAAASLKAAYAEGGTELVKDMIPALARMIAEKAAEKAPAGTGAMR